MLNKEQTIASEINHERVLVLAGPGTGKTTTLISRYKYLIKNGIKPDEIICCTFSRKAADEIKKRLKEQDDLNIKTYNIGTFHSLANQALKELAPSINIKVPKEYLTMEKQRKDIIETIKRENPEILKKFKFNEKLPSEILKYIDDVRERLVDAEDAFVEASEIDDELFICYSKIYKLYEEYLSKNELIDYPRMIQYAFKAFFHDAENSKEYISKFKHILIDEYQDINFSQKSMIDQILRGGSNLWVVGDDDQAIYGWRGSNVKFILDFEINYPGSQKVILKTNYRSENNIVNAANNLSKNFIQRHEKNIISFGNNEGEVKVFQNKDEFDEAEQIHKLIKVHKNKYPYREFSVLARTNNLPQELIEHLLNTNIPFVLKNGIDFFNDPSAYELLTASAISGSIKPEKKWNRNLQPKLYGFAKKLSEETNWKKKIRSLATYIINNLPKSLTDEELEDKVSEIEFCHKYLSKHDNPEKAFEKLRRIFNSSTNEDAVHVGTIHGAKGLEWETVVLMGCEDDKLPHSLTREPHEFEEERRIAYVAITRPRTNLYLTWATKRDGFYKIQSPYLIELLGKKTELKKAVSEKVISNDTLRYLTFRDEVREYKEQQKEQNKPMSKEEITELIANNRRAINTSIADGLGKGNEWKIRNTGNGFLYEVGYTAIKDGPGINKRHQILADVFHGKIDMPKTLKKEVAKTWGNPMTSDRLRKIRNTINTALGAQKGKTNSSIQAIKKWEEDLHFIDYTLKKEL